MPADDTVRGEVSAILKIIMAVVFLRALQCSVQTSCFIAISKEISFDKFKAWNSLLLSLINFSWLSKAPRAKSYSRITASKDYTKESITPSFKEVRI